MGAWSGEYHIAIWIEDGIVYVGERYISNDPDEKGYYLLHDYGATEDIIVDMPRYLRIKADAVLEAVEFSSKAGLQFRLDWRQLP